VYEVLSLYFMLLYTINGISIKKKNEETHLSNWFDLTNKINIDQWFPKDVSAFVCYNFKNILEILSPSIIPRRRWW